MSTFKTDTFRWTAETIELRDEFERQIEKEGTSKSAWVLKRVVDSLQGSESAGSNSADSTQTDEILLALQELGTQIAKQPAPDINEHLDQVLKRLTAIEQQQSQLQSRLATAFAAVLADGGKIDREAAKAWADQHFK